MKITFVLPAPPWRPVGGFRVVYEYAGRLAARGHGVTVVHPSRMRNVPVKTGWKGYVRKIGGYAYNKVFRPKVSWLPVDPRVRLLPVWEPREDAVPDADYVFATAWQTAEYVNEYPAAKGAKCYLVMDFAPWLGSRDTLERTWKFPMKKIAICRWLEETVKACGASDACSVPLGIDQERFRTTADPASRGAVVALMYSRAGYKDLKTGLRALEFARKEGASFRCVSFGPSGDRPEELPAWIEYRGKLPDAELVRLYNEAGVFVGCSLAEGFALPPAEAMACGCAVASTDCGGNRDYAVDGRNALVSPPGDAEALGRNVLRLLNDRDLRLRLAEAGRETIRAFHWERSADLLLKELPPRP